MLIHDFYMGNNPILPDEKYKLARDWEERLRKEPRKKSVPEYSAHGKSAHG